MSKNELKLENHDLKEKNIFNVILIKNRMNKSKIKLI